jgi:hypothetical protein
MRILVVSPSALRFDATVHDWHAEFAAVVGYLRRRFPSAYIVAIPAGLVCAPQRVVVAELLQRPDFLLLWSRVWEAPAARELASLCRAICPRTRTLVWGEGTVITVYRDRNFRGLRPGLGRGRHRPAHV